MRLLVIPAIRFQKRRVDLLIEKAESAFEATGDKQRLLGETQYAAATWDHKRRVIMQAERLFAGPDTRFIVEFEGRSAGTL